MFMHAYKCIYIYIKVYKYIFMKLINYELISSKPTGFFINA